MELANLSSSLPLARRLPAGIQVLPYGSQESYKIYLKLSKEAPSGQVEKQRENLIAKIGFDVGQAINSFSPELGGRQGG